MSSAESAWSLIQTAKQLTVAGQTDEAIAALEEAVSIQRHLAAAHPDTFMYARDVALGLAELADAYAQARRGAEAIAAGDEGVAILRTLSTSHPFLSRDSLDALSRNGSMKVVVGEVQGAASDLGAAVRGFRTMATHDRPQYEPGLGVAMGRLRALAEAVFLQQDGQELLEQINTLLLDVSADDITPDPHAASTSVADAHTDVDADASRPVGCDTCWGSDPVAVYENRGSTLDRYATLVSESHFVVSLKRCRTCDQLFASIFTEYIDWHDGEDPQHTVLVPVSRTEADDLIAARITVFAIGGLAAGRRHLHSDWPSRARQRVYWSEGAFTVDPGE